MTYSFSHVGIERALRAVLGERFDEPVERVARRHGQLWHVFGDELAKPVLHGGMSAHSVGWRRFWFRCQQEQIRATVTMVVNLIQEESGDRSRRSFAILSHYPFDIL